MLLTTRPGIPHDHIVAKREHWHEWLFIRVSWNREHELKDTDIFKWYRVMTLNFHVADKTYYHFAIIPLVYLWIILRSTWAGFNRGVIEPFYANGYFVEGEIKSIKILIRKLWTRNQK